MSTRFFIASDVCSATDDDGCTILKVERGIVYSLIAVAARIWAELSDCADGRSEEEIISSLTEDFPHVPLAQIQMDVLNILNQLRQKELITTTTRNQSRSVGWIRTSSNVVIRLCVQSLLMAHLNFVAALFQLLVVDLTLRHGGFSLLHKTVKGWPCGISNEHSVALIQAMTKAIARAVRYYPKDSLCLQRSASLTCLLRSCGVEAQMVIGCRKMPFKGHAWVEVNGEVVNDNSRVQIVCNSILERC
jgi:hypothetical protein